jgi:hypothetical protein
VEEICPSLRVKMMETSRMFAEAFSGGRDKLANEPSSFLASDELRFIESYCAQVREVFFYRRNDLSRRAPASAVFPRWVCYE